MRDSRKNQAAVSTTAAAATSAIQAAARAETDREFTRLYLQLGDSGRRQVAHMVEAFAAGDRRNAIAWAYHWAAFVAVNPRAAWRAAPTLRRIAQIGAVVAAVIALLVLTACSGGDVRTLAGADMPAPTAQPATQTATDQPQIGSILPAETPDIQPAQMDAQPVAVEVMATPTPPMQVQACNPSTPFPLPLDDSDRAAGVIVKGAACEVQP